MDITKVKFSGGDVTIEYEKRSKSGAPERKKLEVTDEPLPSFQEAMDELVSEVVNVGRLGESWSDGHISGVTMKHTDDGIGMTATLQLKVPEIGTPLLYNSPYLKPGDQSVNIQGVLSRICIEAKNYLQGERKNTQLSLLPGGKKAS